PWKNRKPRSCPQTRRDALLFTSDDFCKGVAAGTLNQFERLRTSASMADLADLYPGFASHWIDTAAGRVFARSGGEGPPPLLLPGHPPNNRVGPRLAPALAAHFTPTVSALPGHRPPR